MHLAREADDDPRDKTAHKDAVLSGQLTSRLDCYLPERAEEDETRLRHPGQHRFRLLGEVVGACGVHRDRARRGAPLRSAAGMPHGG
ncbi:MAG: hypothetical protein JO281_00080 [Pseudonocardiales bacterium]|nr:hypothetical protein [Pseudonocardiales bacterium]